MYSIRAPETPLLLFALDSMEKVVFWATPIWTGWQGNSLDPDLFGCKVVDDLLEPFSVNKEPALPFLVEVKMCKCTKGCRTRIY